MSQFQPESLKPAEKPELITEIPARIVQSLGARADTGPVFEFPPVGGQQYEGVKFTDQSGNTTGILVSEREPNGTTTERTLRGEELAAFLAANPDVAQQL